uniref:NADPH-dependent FMN reductase-like domain-containing protein n=1 Tax=Globisporangium ultimum (strain ATCC 200006 / CBS 805.95 / DAOM BR144) TaxID=431595 RepID=K3XCC9_GLOUD
MMNAHGSVLAEKAPLLDQRSSSNAPLVASTRARESTRVDLRRLGAIGLVLFCLVTAVGLVRVIAISNQVLETLKQVPAVSHGVAASVPSTEPWVVFPAGNGSSTGLSARVLIVYSDGTYLSKLAHAVEQGVRSVLVDNNGTTLRVRTVGNASYKDDVMWADAVILGSHVINANVEPKMSEFMSTWAISDDLSRKIGAVFVTGGGISSGEELTMVNLLHSMMIFRMIIVGGERWTSAFGASAIVSEGPFQSREKVESGTNEFPSLCYPTDPDGIHEMFKDKAVGLGRRVAGLAALLRQHTQ